MNFVNNMISNAVNSIHTAYLGKVLRINGNKATVQPLSRYQEVGQSASEQAVVSALILNNARYKLKATDINFITNVTAQKETKTIEGNSITYVKDIAKETGTEKVITATEIQPGDVVLCVVCERDISGQTSGQVTTPDSTMNYSLSNSVIVGVV